MIFGRGFDSRHLHQPSPRLRLARHVPVEALFFSEGGLITFGWQANGLSAGAFALSAEALAEAGLISNLI